MERLCCLIMVSVLQRDCSVWAQEGYTVVQQLRSKDIGQIMSQWSRLINIFRTKKLQISTFWKLIRKNENLFNYFVLYYVMKLMASWVSFDKFLGNNNHLYWQNIGQKIQSSFVTGNHSDHISNIFIKFFIEKFLHFPILIGTT